MTQQNNPYAGSCLTLDVYHTEAAINYVTEWILVQVPVKETRRSHKYFT